jgi:hypothetical protein
MVCSPDPVKERFDQRPEQAQQLAGKRFEFALTPYSATPGSRALILSMVRTLFRRKCRSEGAATTDLGTKKNALLITAKAFRAPLARRCKHVAQSLLLGVRGLRRLGQFALSESIPTLRVTFDGQD